MKWITQSIIILSTAVISIIITYQFTKIDRINHSTELVEIQTIEKVDEKCEFEKIDQNSLPIQASQVAIAISKTIPIQVDTIENPSRDLDMLALVENEQRLTKEISHRIEQQNNHIDTIQKFSESHHQNYNEILQNKFNEEEIDYEWADKREEQIYSLFDTNEVLNMITPENISCKSKNCQVVLSASDQSQIDTLYTTLLDAVLTVEGKNTSTTISYFTDPNSGQLTLYVSDDATKNLFENDHY